VDQNITEDRDKDFVEQNIVKNEGKDPVLQNIEGTGTDFVEQIITEGSGHNSIEQNIIEGRGKAETVDEMIERILLKQEPLLETRMAFFESRLAITAISFSDAGAAGMGERQTKIGLPPEQELRVANEG
jgi:hypothetical protein